MYDVIRQHRIVAILRNIPHEDLLSCAEFLHEGGIRIMEVTANSDSWTDEIRALRRHFAKGVKIGAGTILTPQAADQAVAAGAEFILTPNTDELVLKFCSDNKISMIPGVMTPSDVGLCLRYGFDLLKLFPAVSLPVDYIKNLKGPFDKSEYIAVGGITRQNARQFIEAGFTGVGLRSALISRKILADQDWNQLKSDTLTLVHDLSRKKL